MTMNVFINAISIAEGGGVVVLKYLLEAACNEAPNVKWYVAAEPNILAQIPKSDTVVGVPYTWAKNSPFHHLYWYEIELPKILRQLNADVCFSQTNFLPRRQLPCPSLLLIQNAGYFSEKFNQLYLGWNKKKIGNVVWKQKNKWVRQSIKRATMVTVQTEALAEKIVKQVGAPRNKIIVIPHGPGLLKVSNKTLKHYPLDMPWRIGYITKFGVQKNFGAVIKAISQLKSKGMPVKLVLTLNPKGDEYLPILQMIREYGIEEIVENHGDISDANKIKELYESLHIFVFPSFCESFGFTLVEAMATGLPLIVADTDSNREITGEDGISYTSENENDLTEKISQLITNKSLYVAASKHSLKRSCDFSWKKAARNILNTLNELTIQRSL
jgi:glycosyltransferase involved in cell wall biosynthesis